MHTYEEEEEWDKLVGLTVISDEKDNLARPPERCVCVCVCESVSFWEWFCVDHVEKSGRESSEWCVNVLVLT